MKPTLEFLSIRRSAGLFIWGTFLLVAVFCFTPPSILEAIDYVLYYWPNIHFLRDALLELRIPLWNPYVGLGRPFLADMQTAVFYPPTYLLVLGGAPGLFLFLWLHMLLAAVGMFALGRALGMRDELSRLVGFALVCAPALTGRLFAGQVFYAAGLCYVPLVFLLATRLSDQWSARLAAGFSLVLAAQFLSGHPQVFWYSVIASGVFVLARTASIRSIGRFLLVCLWCAGLIAVVLLPFYELIGQGNRAGVSLEFASFGALRWSDFAILVSSPSDKASWEKNFYIGLPATAIGLLGLTMVRDKNVRGLWAVIIVSSFVALGPNSPLFNLFCDWLPGYSTMRLHARMTFMISFALLVCGGMWVTKMSPRLLLLAQMNFNFKKPLLVGAASLLLLTPLVIDDLTIKQHSLAYILRVSPKFPFQWRVVDAIKRENLQVPQQPPPLICVDPILFPVNFAMVHHLATFDSYTSLFLKGPWDYFHETLKLPDPGAVNTCLTPQVYTQAFPFAELPIALAYDPAQLRLVRNPKPPPKAFLVPTNSGSVSFLRYDCNSMLLETTSDSSADLVVTEAWYPGWRARIGSGTQASFPTNGWMRGFHVPPGKHRVELYFQQNYLGLGAAVSLVSFVLCLALSGWCRFRNPRL